MSERPIKIAVEHLDNIGFTCYWAGKGELWRITGCWLPQFRGAFWSNVACANLQLAPSLLRITDTVFLETISTTLHPKSPIEVMGFLDHNESRYDKVVLCDADENDRYELTAVVDTYQANQKQTGGVSYKQLPSVWVPFKSLQWTENLRG